MKTKKRSLLALSITFIVCVLLALTTMLISGGVIDSRAAGVNPLRYDGVNTNQLETYYLKHWRTGQGLSGEGDAGGKWYFGYGDVSTSAYSFTEATKNTTEAPDDTARYKTGTSHQMCFGYNVSTRLYSSANTQTLYVWEATDAGKVSFTGFYAKNSEADMEAYLGTTIGVPSTENNGKVWLPFNWSDSAFDWVNNQSYTISVFRVNKNGVKTQLDSQTFTTGYAYFVPSTEYEVVEGDKIVFGLKCNSVGDAPDEEWNTNTIVYLASKYTKKIQTAYTFGSNMILQRNQPVNVYGYSATGTVTVQFNGQTKTATPDANGDWLVTLDAMSANATGQNLVISDSVDTITYENVRVGEVWYCGGQSNMEYTLGALLLNRGHSDTDVWNGNVDYSTSAIRDYMDYTNWDKINVYSVPYNSTSTPDKYGIQNQYLVNGWAKGSSITSFLGFSAYALGFALKLQQNLGDVPVGIIVNARGGSSVEEWVSNEAAVANSLTITQNTEQSAYDSHKMYYGRTYATNNHTVNGLLWYQGCSDDNAEGTSNNEGTSPENWKKWMKVLIEEFRESHGNVPVIAQLMVENATPDGEWKYIRDAILSLMNGDATEKVDNYYAVNGIGFGIPYEYQIASGNYIHPADKKELSANAADIATTRVYDISGYNDVAEYPVAAYKSGNDVIIEYDADVTLKLDVKVDGATVGTTVNNLEAYDGTTWSKVTNATISGNKITISGSSATAIRYAAYNLMDPNGMDRDTGKYADHYVSGTWHEFLVNYNNGEYVNLYSTKTGCPDVAVFPILEMAVSSTAPTPPTTYTASVTNDDAMGSVVGIVNGQSYNENSNLTIVVTANTGYDIASINLNGSPVEVTNVDTMSIPHTVTGNITLIVTYEAEYVAPTYQASVTNDNSKGTVSGIVDGESYEENANVTIAITALTGYDISSITLNGAPVTVANKNTMSIPHTVTGAINLVVVYVEETYSVTINNGVGGSVSNSITAGTDYAKGHTFTNVVITADVGYKISSVMWAGQAITVENDKTFTIATLIVNKNSVLMVVYEKETCNVTVTVDETKGSVSGIVTGQYEYGTTINKITVSAKDGYVIKKVTVNGVDKTITNNAVLEFAHTINEETTITVEFEAKAVVPTEYQITVSNDSSKGTVAGAQTKKYAQGTQLNITITAKAGYKVKTVTWGAKSINVGNGASVTFSETVTADATLSVTYEAVSSTPNTPSGDNTGNTNGGADAPTTDEPVEASCLASVSVSGLLSVAIVALGVAIILCVKKHKKEN